MTTANARAVFGPKETFKETILERRDLGPKDVLIDIKYTGICHSDIHTARSEWWPTNYPVVPGHEIAGVVTQVWTEVKKYSIWDRVWVWCMVDSCWECVNCNQDEEQFCLKGSTLTYWSMGSDWIMTQWWYSTNIVVTEDFVLKIPDNIELSVAAPLLCAGITTYSPLRHWNAGPGKKVAVVWLGGLWHMAVKIAHAMWAEVTVLSHSLNKKDDGMRFGAKEYYSTSDTETFKKLAGRFDIIINTISAEINVDAYLSLLAVNWSLINVGAPADPLSINAFSLILWRKSFSGSLIWGIKETQEMLDFCAEHNIGPDIEIIWADEIDTAFERILKSDVRYRFVIDINTMAK
jgi:alcohol dehydrogenase (NADP+)